MTTYPPTPPQLPPSSTPAPHAGFALRFAGWLFDGALYGMLVSVLAIPGILFTIAAFPPCERVSGGRDCPAVDGSQWLIGTVLILLSVLVVGVLYLWALGTTGQTWGRKLVGAKVVRRGSGEPIGIGRAIGRSVVAFFVSGPFMYIGYLWLLWDKRGQTWHDKLADSIVVKA